MNSLTLHCLVSLLAICVGLASPALAHASDDHQADPNTAEPSFYVDEIAAFIGKPLPAEYKAGMADISSTFRFKQPTTIFAGELQLKVDDDSSEADVMVFLRQGKICGIEVIYVPEDSTEFGALPFAEQQARFDHMYGHIADNYAGDSGGKTLIYDDSGGLYEYKDPAGVWWTLSWTPDVELSLSFDSKAFKDEHALDRMDRAGTNLTGT
jgi:hypothetical protein